jgi:hypothetical protein
MTVNALTVILCAFAGAGLFAAGAYFRHRVIKTEPPMPAPREGNAWTFNVRRHDKED